MRQRKTERERESERERREKEKERLREGERGDSQKTKLNIKRLTLEARQVKDSLSKSEMPKCFLHLTAKIPTFHLLRTLLRLKTSDLPFFPK